MLKSMGKVAVQEKIQSIDSVLNSISNILDKMVTETSENNISEKVMSYAVMQVEILAEAHAIEAQK